MVRIPVSNCLKLTTGCQKWFFLKFAINLEKYGINLAKYWINFKNIQQGQNTCHTKILKWSLPPLLSGLAKTLLKKDLFLEYLWYNNQKKCMLGVMRLHNNNEDHANPIFWVVFFLFWKFLYWFLLNKKTIFIT